MQRKNSKGSTHEKLTAKCAITGAPKYPGSITQAEEQEQRTCKQCRTHYPRGSGVRLRGYSGVYICDQCDPNYYDIELILGDL